MVWGIIGALEKEVELIKNSMALEKSARLFGSECYVGSYAGQKLIVVCSGIGKVNAAVCASALIREFGAEAIINVGIAGALGHGLEVLDVVISDSVVFHDIDLDLFSRYYPYRRSFEADSKLIVLAVRAVESMEGRRFGYKVGCIATGDAFINSREVKESIQDRLSPLCVEMEGAAVGEAAYMNGVPFIIIRAMSDNADEDADTAYDNLFDLAAHNSASIVLRMIEGK